MLVAAQTRAKFRMAVAVLVGLLVLSTACTSAEQGAAPPADQLDQAAAEPSIGATATAVAPTPTPSATATPVPTATPAPPTPRPAPTPVPGSLEPFPLDPAVRIGVLDNGLRYFVRENNSPGARAEFRLVVDVGSALEADDQLSAAHVLEHMMFNGTELYPGNEIVSVLESFGTAFGADLNAYTTYEETVYTLSVPAEQSLMRQALSVLEQWADKALIDEAEVEAERGVVLEEWRLGREGVGGRIGDAFQHAILDGTRYDGRSPISTDDAILDISAGELRAFYETWYRPERMSIVAVGDFDAATVETWIADTFAPLSDRAPEQDDPLEPLPTRATPAALSYLDPELPTAYAEISFPGPPVATDTAHGVTRSLRLDLAFEMAVARLADLVLGGALPAGDVVRSETGVIAASLAPAIGVESLAENQAALLEAILVEVERIRRFGFTEGELAAARSEFRAVIQQGLDTLATKQDWQFADELVEYALRGGALQPASERGALEFALLDSITADDVTAEFDAFLGERAPLIATLGPATDRERIVDEEAAIALFAAVRVMDLADSFEDGEVPEQLMEPPEPADVLATQPLPDSDAVRLTMENGATVILKSSSIAEGSVSFAAVSPGGLAEVADGDVGRLRLINDVVAQSGLGPHDRVAVEAILRDDVVSWAPSMNDDYEAIFGNSSVGDLEDLLQVVHLLMREPRADETALVILDGQVRTVLGDPTLVPHLATAVTAQELRFPGLERFRIIPDLDDLDDVDLDVDLAVFAERFANAADFTFVLVGDFDVPEVTVLARRYLATLPSGGPLEEANADLLAPPPPTIMAGTVRAGSGNQGTLQITFTEEVPVSAQQRMTMNVLQEATSIVLRDELRERLSASYSPSVTARFSSFDERYAILSLDIAADPDRLDEISMATVDLLGAMASDGVPSAAYTTASELLRRRYELVNNEYWMEQFVSAAVVPNYGVIGLDRRRELLAGVTPATVDAMAEQLFDTAQYVEVRQEPIG